MRLVLFLLRDCGSLLVLGFLES
uniref:Uncharacterized protein n=1 Tax=Rhizophora mucronata TaxID=61149 RepID=A0A2P2PZF8_RHIMU